MMKYLLYLLSALLCIQQSLLASTKNYSHSFAAFLAPASSLTSLTIKERDGVEYLKSRFFQDPMDLMNYLQIVRLFKANTSPLFRSLLVRDFESQRNVEKGPSSRFFHGYTYPERRFKKLNDFWNQPCSGSWGNSMERVL